MTIPTTRSPFVTFISKKAFTLMEFLVVIILITIIAGFSITSFEKAVDRSDERSALLNLNAIQLGMEIYKSRHGTYPLVSSSTANEINVLLGLSIVPGNLQYSCWGPGFGSAPGSSWTCSAARNKSTFQESWFIRQGTNFSPVCYTEMDCNNAICPPGGGTCMCLASGSCPTCTSIACP